MEDQINTQVWRKVLNVHENIHGEICSHMESSHVCQALVATIISLKMTIILSPK